MPGLPAAADNKADAYLKQRNIPQLFQSLTVALLYNQPEDHIEYLQNCLDTLQARGGGSGSAVAWDTFLPPPATRPPTSPGPVQQGAADTPHGTLVPGERQKNDTSI